MATTTWLFLGLAGWLSAACSGLQAPTTPAPAEHNTSSSEAPGPGAGLGVRLTDTSSHCSGEVEVRLGAIWVPVCGAKWDQQASEAACHELGCGGAEATPEPEPRTPVGNTSVSNATPVGNTSVSNATRGPLLSVWCRGPEWGLCEAVEAPCGADVPARVTCADAFALRLVGGGSPCAGRVEMLERGAWGTVCDDAWDLPAASVACRQLGCGWAVEAAPGGRFPAGHGPIHRDELTCAGHEEHLWDCAGRPGQGYCGHKEDAGVVCSEHQSWSLTGGSDRCDGQVEVHFRGVRSSVCDSVWYQPEADVLCRALGCGRAVAWAPGQPHSLPGRMFYSCTGEEARPSLCTWRFNNSNLCSQSQAARVLCSGSPQTLHDLSSPHVPSSAQPVTADAPVTVAVEGGHPRELLLLVPSIVLGVLLLGALVCLMLLLLRMKGKYALPVAEGHRHLLPTATPAGSNSYHTAPLAVPKEEAPQPLPHVQAAPPEESDSSSGSDYEHYDFSAQPPVALTTFYNSQRYRVTEEEAQQSRFRMPPLEEGPEELRASPVLAALPGPCASGTALGGPQCYPGGDSGSSTSSGEDYCNSPGGQPPPWDPHELPLEQSPALELAGPPTPFLGSGRPEDDGSSTSSGGDWYQNFRSTPQPHPHPTEQFECPGPSGPRLDSSSSSLDYDDIGAS